MSQITPNEVRKIIELHKTGCSIDKVLREVNNDDWDVSFWLEDESLSVLSGIYREGGDDMDCIDFISKTGFEESSAIFNKLMRNDKFRIMRFKGKEWCDYVIENALYMLAKGHWVEEWKEILVDGEKVRLTSRRFVQSVTPAVIKWLDARKEDKWRIDNKLGASESEGQMKGLLNEAKTFGIESGITKLRNMKKGGGYSDEEIGKYEKLYLGRYYNELIDKIYEPYTTKELLNYVAKGD